MDSRRTARGLSEAGVSSVQFLLAASMALVLFLVFANLIVVQYGRGALQSALDQGARVAAITGSVDQCRVRVDEVLDQLLGGKMGEGVTADCELAGGLAVVTATAVFDSWTPLSPDFEMEMSAEATIETGP